MNVDGTTSTAATGNTSYLDRSWISPAGPVAAM